MIREADDRHLLTMRHKPRLVSKPLWGGPCVGLGSGATLQCVWKCSRWIKFLLVLCGLKVPRRRMFPWLLKSSLEVLLCGAGVGADLRFIPGKALGGL